MTVNRPVSHRTFGFVEKELGRHLPHGTFLSMVYDGTHLETHRIIIVSYLSDEGEPSEIRVLQMAAVRVTRSKLSIKLDMDHPHHFSHHMMDRYNCQAVIKNVFVHD